MENYKELPMVQIEVIMQETRDEIDSLDKKQVKLEEKLEETQQRLVVLRSRRDELRNALERGDKEKEALESVPG